MPDDKIKISALPSALSLNNTDVFSVVQGMDGDNKVTSKAALTVLAAHLLEVMQYNNLDTASKTIVDAINSVLDNLADEYDESLTYSVGDCVQHNGLLYQCNTDISTAEAWDPTHWTQIKAVDVGAGGGGGGLPSDVIAPDYDSSQTYAVGDYVMHEDQLYECNTDISTAEAWTAAHWTLTDVESMVGDVQSDIDELNTKIYGGFVPIDTSNFELNKAWGYVTVGSTMPENPGVSGYANYAGKISVKNGDIIAYRGSVGGTSKMIYLTDTSGVVLSFVEADSVGSTVTVANDGYAYITVLSTSEYAFALFSINYLSNIVENNTKKVNSLSSEFNDSLFKEDFLPLRIIDSGSINYFNGYDNSDPAVLPLRCRTSGYIDKNIDKVISKNASYTFGLFAYQEDGTFVGVWNGTTWQKTSNYWNSSVDGLIEKGYRYRLVWNRNNATVSPIDVRPVTKATTYNFETVEELKSKNDNRLFLDSPVNAPFKCPAYNSITGGNIATFAEIYAKFDALVAAYPTYITKTKIGEANNDANLPIYKYVFKPKRPHYDEVTATRNANILLIGGEHGEQVGATCVYNVMEQICNNWQSDELLEALRFNPTFTVIPVLNVWGYDAGKRVNANNVNLNRNYGTGWIAIPDTEEQNYSGTKPFSEIETQCVRDILKAEKFDIVFDVHNPAPTQGLYFAGETSIDFTYTQTGVSMSVNSEMSTNMMYKAIQRLTRIWDSRGLNLPYPTGAISGEFHGVCVGAEAGGMSCLYANDLGVPIAGVLEVCPKVDITGATYGDSASQTFAFETVINMLLMSLDYISLSGV